MSRDALHVVDDLALDRGTGRTDGVRIVNPPIDTAARLGLDDHQI